MWPSCDPDKKMCNGGVEICVVSKIGNLKFWYCNYDNERRDINGKGLSFPDFLLTKYGKSQTDSEASSQKSNKPRPRDYTFREWTLIKVGHTDIIYGLVTLDRRRREYNLKGVDGFLSSRGRLELYPKGFLEAFVNNPTHRSFDNYKCEFNLEINKLADEYELGIRKKGHILDNIWEYCNQVHNKNYEWHNYEYENEECEEIGIEDKDYHLPEVQVETFEVKKYSFEGGQSFICVTKDVDNILPLGRKNRSKFKEMIRKEVENNKT
ncbi:hypothetical protein Tco_0466291 [Tanacetum coccineum]